MPASVTNAVALATGAFHNLALNADGTVVAWGKNVDGQADVPASATTAAEATAVRNITSRQRSLNWASK